MASELKRTPAAMTPSSSTHEKKKQRRAFSLVSQPPYTPAGSPDKKKKKNKKTHNAWGSENASACKRGRREGGAFEAGPWKKPTFDRVWSEENEIKLLRALLRLRKEARVDPACSVDQVARLLRLYLNLPFNRNQVCDKIRRLKRWWESVGEHMKNTRVELSDLHDTAVFELAQQIWKSPQASPVGLEPPRHLRKVVEQLEVENADSGPKGFVWKGFKRLHPLLAQELDQKWKAHLLHGIQYSVQEKALKVEILRACVESLGSGGL